MDAARHKRLSDRIEARLIANGVAAEAIYSRREIAELIAEGSILAGQWLAEAAEQSGSFATAIGRA